MAAAACSSHGGAAGASRAREARRAVRAGPAPPRAPWLPRRPRLRPQLGGQERGLGRLRLRPHGPPHDQAEVRDRDLQDQHHEDELPDHCAAVYPAPSLVEPEPQPGIASTNHTIPTTSKATTTAISQLRAAPRPTATSVSVDPDVDLRVLVDAELQTD